jgi:hypothetical protein
MEDNMDIIKTDSIIEKKSPLPIVAGALLLGSLLLRLCGIFIPNTARN